MGASFVDARWVRRHGEAGSGGTVRTMSDTVLVIAAHPDDEILGCGGTVALHTRRGDKVTAVIACEGESLRYGSEGVGQADHMRRAPAELGVEDVRPLGFADQRLDTLPLTDVITQLE